MNMMNKYITPNRDNAKKIEVKVNHVFLSINLLSQYGLYLVIGLIIFLLPEIEILRKEDVLPYIIIILSDTLRDTAELAEGDRMSAFCRVSKLYASQMQHYRGY